MPAITFKNRRAVMIENDELRITVMVEGGHLAEVFDKRTGVNPLWQPPWPTMEPSKYDPTKNPEYGAGSEARLLSGILGHNLCLDIFGGPTAAEAESGLTVHGEASVVTYEVSEGENTITLKTLFPLTQIAFERTLELRGNRLRIRERVENLAAWDRPIGWTQHVTLGPPFLEKGATEFRASVTRSKVIENELNSDMQMWPGSEFEWPLAPLVKGGSADMRMMSNAAASSEFSTHLADPAHEYAFFAAFAPAHQLVFGYAWKCEEFPWLGIWQENYSRKFAPWNGHTLALGMEFGVSPFPESRRAMVERGKLFDQPAFRWLPAKGHLDAEYCAVLRQAKKIPESIEWPD
jgi:hypothetical protein